MQVGIPSQPVQLALDHLVTSEISLLTTNGHVCATDLPAALELLATTDLARRVGYDIIPLDMLVAEGLQPLVEHRAHRKMLVNIQAPTTNLKKDAHERTAL